MCCLITALSNLAVVTFPNGYEETNAATLGNVASTPGSGNHRREIASACESGPEMTAFGPIADGFDEVAGGRLLTPSRHSTGPSTNGSLRPETVIGRGLTECPLVDQKAAIRANCCGAE